jgi:hypothetical protein
VADGLFNLIGRRAIELTKDGRVYRLAVRTLADHALKEQAILQRMGSPYAGLEEIKDPAQRQAAFRIAADVAARPLIATLQDEERFDESLRGIGYSVWRALSVHHPEEFPPSLPIERGIQLGCDFVEWFNDIKAIIHALHKAEERPELGN